jgi:hypothetical protein
MTGACIAHFVSLAESAVVYARTRAAAAGPARGPEKPRSEAAPDVG